MLINSLGNQLSNLESSFSENSIGNNSSDNRSELFPMDVIGQIAKYTDFDTSKILMAVSKRISNVILIQNEERKKLVKGMAFGREEWLKFYDLDLGREPLLPRDIIEILNMPCYMDSTRNLRDTHILTLIPKDLSLKSLGLLAKKYFNTTTGYEYVDQCFLKTEKPNDKSYWVLMSKGILKGSKNKWPIKQEKMIAELSQKANVNCELPTPLEAAASIITHQVRLGERLFSDNPMTYTLCLDGNKEGRLMAVGGFALSGLNVKWSCCGIREIGSAVLRKFQQLSIK